MSSACRLLRTQRTVIPIQSSSAGALIDPFEGVLSNRLIVNYDFVNYDLVP